MTRLVLLGLNLALLAIFAVVLRRPGLLGFAKGGKWYLTLMDELTSVFYAPAEAHRFIGSRAIFFIAFTSLLMRLLSSRMVEIAQILELHDIRGGGSTRSRTSSSGRWPRSWPWPRSWSTTFSPPASRR